MQTVPPCRRTVFSLLMHPRGRFLWFACAGGIDSLGFAFQISRTHPRECCKQGKQTQVRNCAVEEERVRGLANGNDATGRRRELFGLLGELPPCDRAVSAKVKRVDGSLGYHLERLELDLNGIEPVPAYFVKPHGADGPLPTVLYNHAHGGDYGLGKEELLRGHGKYLQAPAYAEELTRRGYAALCIDAWTFGERHHRSEGVTFKQMLLTGQVLWGMMLYDNLKALDYLQSRQDVDEQRLGTLGFSMGGGLSWWTAALDERIRVCVDLCFLTDYHTLIKANRLGTIGFHHLVPNLLLHFSAADINALIAPRAHLSIIGVRDRLAAGAERIDSELRQVYLGAGASDAWRLSHYDAGHQETEAARAEALAFLDRWLLDVTS